ncbi:malonyl CoA-acyl carrier protein transacylase [Mycobacterium avium subsp. avium 2285 (R)]|nr:malonyl CoA-acyl carrier protein transacylase [Mycobacterium avium subsp. avium 2285 (R)]
MLSPWLELDGAADQLALWSKASGLDLVRLGTTASTEEITDTAVTQPLVVAATLLAHQELTRRGLLADADLVVAGHSVGEIAAYAIAGVMAADDAVALAATRGAEMAKACAVEPTGMSAVLGGDEAEVLARLEQLDLFPANRNAAGQIVAAGSLAALEKLAEDPRRRPGCAPSGWPERSTPSTWPRRSTATPPRRPPSRRPSPPPRCCPTATASRSPRRPRRWRRWSPS